MSTERELLEAAARAVGCAHLGVWDDGMGCLSNGEGWWFDPRKEGADAFELAAALRISLEHNPPSCNRPWVCAKVDDRVSSPVQLFMEDVPEESQRADRMRLAILRCAAAQAPKEQA
ncbi:hypothetical protein [Delftia acidovorans]|uniref:hypothetical protein n=1 Tax=Delftia acidovorans TaxID=80866 RepID=UPI0005C1D4E5|nr:hypothetical protein [Delftia acidovorans]QPS74853.1 hypothetical protein I6G48_30335 [Delftia acidovorans]